MTKLLSKSVSNKPLGTKRARQVNSKKVSDLGCGSVAFSPDGHYLIAPSTGGLITWPWDQGGTVRVFKVRYAK